METVNITTLKAGFSKYVGLAARGQEFMIVKRGRHVGVLKALAPMPKPSTRRVKKK